MANTNTSNSRPLAIVTGASTGIGYYLAKQCVENGFGLLVAADDPAINKAAEDLRALGAVVDVVETDLATTEGADELCAAAKDRSSGRATSQDGRAGRRKQNKTILI